MDQHSSSHGDNADHGVHLPDPSMWPFVIGAATLAVGFALVWWSRDRNSDVAGPVLGATLLLLLVAGLGWAYEDGMMKKKKEGDVVPAEREARFTQVLTFAIAEGRMVASRLSGGILAALNSTDNALADLPGFQDMRIIASPAAVGPSQVLVETTWSNREGLATYEETRTTLLDLIAQHPEDVVAGSVQVFDMEVVRDTKPVGFRLGYGSVAALLGSLVVFGFMVGAGLNLFAKDNPAGGSTTPSNGGPAAPAGNQVTATDNKFDKTALEAPPATAVSFIFKNTGQVKHNIHFYDKAGGKTLADGAEGKIIDGGQSETLNFTTPAAGEYYFQCDLHPDQMKGTFSVKAGAAVPGAGAAPAGGGGAAAGGLALVATDNKFDKTTLEAKAGDITVNFKNSGNVPHNVHFLDKKGGKDLAPGALGGILQAGKSEDVKFNAPAGTYFYQCDLHPDQMTGTLKVS